MRAPVFVKTGAAQNGMNVSGAFENIVFRNNVIRGTSYSIESGLTVSTDDLDYDASPPGNRSAGAHAPGAWSRLAVSSLFPEAAVLRNAGGCRRPALRLIEARSREPLIAAPERRNPSGQWKAFA